MSQTFEPVTVGAKQPVRYTGTGTVALIVVDRLWTGKRGEARVRACVCCYTHRKGEGREKRRKIGQVMQLCSYAVMLLDSCVRAHPWVDL